MYNELLISNRCKPFGWLLFIGSAILGLCTLYLEFEIPGFQLFELQSEGFLDFKGANLTNELALVGTIVGLLMICISREKQEDEYISFLRLKALQWSVLINYLILIAITLFVYGSNFFMILFYNSFTVLILFIVKFNLSLYRLRQEGFHEK